MKKLFSIIAWFVAGIYLILVLGFVEHEYEDVACRGLQVRISESLETRLIDPERVEQLVMQVYPGLKGMAMLDINTSLLEKAMLGENTVRNAQVYSKVDGSLVVEITQRRPVIRVQDSDHRDFYLDNEGTVITPDRTYTPHLLLANGAIDGKYRTMENVLSGEDPRDKTMEGLLDLASLIDGDPFWKSQIVQIYINHQGEFELIPRVGSHVILFGTGINMEDKFFRLRTMYNEGFSREGWNQYEFINLKYDRQVICTKR